MLDGEADLGVHSAKDLPGELPDGLALVGVPGREDPADAFIGAAGSLDELPEGARVGTASLRRRSQLLALRPDLEVVELRGNVDTRLRKLAEGELDGDRARRRRAARGSGATDEIAFRFGARRADPGARPGLRWRSRRAPATTRPPRAAAAISDRGGAGRAHRRARRRRAPWRRPATRRSASARAAGERDAGRGRLRRACPTAASGSATGSRAIPSSRRRSARRSPSGCWPRARARSSRAPRREAR